MTKEQLISEILDLLPFDTMVKLDKEFKASGTIAKTGEEYLDILHEYTTSLIDIHQTLKNNAK